MTTVRIIISCCLSLILWYGCDNNPLCPPGPPVKKEISDIVFSPHSVSTESDVTLTLGDINEFMAAHIELIAQNNCVDFSGTNQIWRESDGYMFLPDFSKPNRLILDILIPGTTGSSSGTIIGIIHLKPKANGKVIIDPDSLKFIDIHNDTLHVERSKLDWINITR